MLVAQSQVTCTAAQNLLEDNQQISLIDLIALFEEGPVRFSPHRVLELRQNLEVASWSVEHPASTLAGVLEDHAGAGGAHRLEKNLVALLNARVSPSANHLGKAIDRLLHLAANEVEAWPED